MKDAVATMGDILPDDAGGRDAVHVAVISAIAGHKLSPGEHVGFVIQPSDDKEGTADVLTKGEDPIGIVDPFLRTSVKKGQRFWMYLYPRTITSLRHQWTHPAFPDTVEGTSYSTPSQQLESKRWITEWADQYGVTYTDMIQAAENYLKFGHYFVRGGTFEGESVPKQFWDHFQVVTGRLVRSDERETFFSCSC